ncbi:bifunctional diguanylate cyclase/phosphodiesterase [Nodosilinea sp. P-1105]|uniref:putative bifunctional diguanylate cyclase/phosphodiesterase n=1 Tax=Nodosilinea sp. P-1105 TaxID=2546229 RepID=UPI00146C81C2|nr:bifunctional diguanylate cyclase/phosphodiesterase [Nodosilinea sp. P-1105]NMF81890.1 bifunctional diguanylate cyclase/phosphodiesterase [Nodosilinea sp. P-1105]
METFANGAIAAAYFIIPLTLLPLLLTAKRAIWLNLLLLVAFVFSCGVGHIFSAMHRHSTPWHWITAGVSWAAVIVLLRSRNRLRYLGETFHLLEATWEQALTGKLLCERSGNDLKMIKLNPAAKLITKDLLKPGDRLCEKMPVHRQEVYPYDMPLIDLYLEVLESGEARQLEYQYKGDEISGWYMTLVTPLSSELLYMTFTEVSGVIHDPLTGLYNRRVLEMDLGPWEVCLFIDLDRFKLINDQRGHILGDRLLVAVATVLQDHVQTYNGIAVRNGGDEFLLLLPASDSVELCPTPATIAATVLKGILAIEIEGANVGASIGVASGTIDAFEEDTPINRLLQAAETALREAKRNRRSNLPQHRIQVWNSDLARLRLRQITLEAYLAQRSSETEFSLVYQPICNMQTGAIVGAEALIRWNSARLGRVSPSEFIPVAETTGLVHRISDWVLCNALEQLAQWQDIAPQFTLSINISPLELEDDDFLDRIMQRVSGAGIDSNHFGIEITERGIYRNLDRYLQSLQSLRDMSLRLKVDDFGTGQSGLAQLLQFRFDEVKVDRYFIPTNAQDLEKVAICRAIANLSEGINFTLVAEGIEHNDQRVLMLGLKYQYGQGYLFSQPMTPQKLTTLLEKGICLSPQ